MLRSILILLAVIAIHISVSAQVEKEVQIKIHDTIYFDACQGDVFEHIDLYKKTRFEQDTVDFDSVDGEAFYDAFFNTGDFDVARLPCSYSGSYGVIKHIMTVIDDTGTEHTVIIAMIENGVSAAYMLGDAFMTDEVLYAPKQ